MHLSEPVKGWHSRGYHFHLDAEQLVQSVTFRLHDSVPAELLERWRSELSMAASPRVRPIACWDVRAGSMRSRPSNTVRVLLVACIPGAVAEQL